MVPTPFNEETEFLSDLMRRQKNEKNLKNH
jgi:hypothetical protein